MNLLKKFWLDQSGQDMIEYALLLAFVCLAAAAVFITVGGNVYAIFNATSEATSSAAVKAATWATPS